MRIRLSDLDRERYGVNEEWLPFDGAKLSMQEAELLQDAGFHDPDDWRQGVRGRPVVVDRHFVFETDPETGEQLLDEHGMPVPKTRIDYKAVRALVWLSLRRAGYPVPWTEFDFDTNGWTWELEPEPEGKDDTAASPTPS